MDLSGQVAIVTGAAQGIGRGIALELARAGCDVAIGDLVDRDQTASAAAETIAAIEALGRRAIAVRCDVCRAADCETLVETARDRLGEIDVLVCNAGIMQIGGILDITSEQWRRVLDVNLNGVFECCRAVLPSMVERRRGSIVNIASTTGLRAGGERVAYSTSKFGVVGLSQALAAEVARHGVRINCVCPSFVRSQMTLDEFSRHAEIDDPRELDAAWTRFGQRSQPLGRSVEPEDIGRAVVWLCESDMVVGVALPVTGGDGLPRPG